MTKTLLGMSLISLAFLMTGSVVFAESIVFWFASTDIIYQYLRFLLAVIVTILILTKPPRGALTRICSGLTGAGIGAWTILQTASYNMLVLDTLLFAGTSLAILVITLEMRPQPTTRSKTIATASR